MNTENNIDNLNGTAVNNGVGMPDPNMNGVNPVTPTTPEVAPTTPNADMGMAPNTMNMTPMGATGAAPSNPNMMESPQPVNPPMDNMAVEPPATPTAPEVAAPTPNMDMGVAPEVNNPQPAPASETIPEMTPVQNDMATVSDGAPTPMNVNDMVSPTNLEQTDISSFGQEGIPLNNINQNPKPSSLESVTKSDEYNNIGSVPENAHVEQKPKRELNVKFVILLAVLLIIGIGVGIFLYLRLGNKAASKLKVKDVKVQLSENISTNVKDYVISGTVDSSCVTNFDDVQVNKIGKYTYKIICNSGTFPGSIEVVDELAPTVVTKIAFKTVGEEITENDFIESCEDISGCTSVISDEETVKGYLATAGTYEVNLNVKDQYNNAKDVSTFLIVTDEEVSKNLVCTSKAIENAEENYSYQIKDTVGILIQNGVIKNAGFTIRDYIITYSTDEAYNTAKSSIKEDNTIETTLASGKASYNDESKEIAIKKIMTSEELTTEFETYPDDYIGLRTLYQNNANEYECEMISN